MSELFRKDRPRKLVGLHEWMSNGLVQWLDARWAVSPCGKLFLDESREFHMELVDQRERTLRISALDGLRPDWNPHCPEGQIRWGSGYLVVVTGC